MTEEDELTAIRRTLDGEVAAFEILVTSYQDSLVRMLASLLHDQHRLAEDVAQDVMVEAYRRLPSFDPARSRFSTWLFMIARSRGINALKRKRPQLFAEPPEKEAPNHDAIDSRETFTLLDQALHDLPPKQKRAFILAVLEERPHAEVAQIECTTVGTIKSRVSRAREFLRIALQQHQP